jgi:hypothetical protein
MCHARAMPNRRANLAIGPQTGVQARAVSPRVIAETASAPSGISGTLRDSVAALDGRRQDSSSPCAILTPPCAILTLPSDGTPLAMADNQQTVCAGGGRQYEAKKIRS